MTKPPRTLRLDGELLDLDTFYRRILHAPDSPARDLLLAIRNKDLDTHATHLKALLESPLHNQQGTLTLELHTPFEAKSSRPTLAVQQPKGFRPASNYPSPTPLTRRQMVLASTGAGIAAALVTMPTSRENPTTTEEPATAPADTPSTAQPYPIPASSIPWAPILSGTGTVGLGYVLSRMVLPAPSSLGTETTRRSLLGVNYVTKPLDSKHAADNLLTILNSFLPAREQGLSR